MNLSTPWTPTVNGNALPMFKRLKVVVDSGASPSPRRDKAWLPSSVEGSFTDFPDAKEPILDCVLSLWRLGEASPDENDDGQDDMWRKHVSAWLVSNLLSPAWRNFADTGGDSIVTATYAGISGLSRSRLLWTLGTGK